MKFRMIINMALWEAHSSKPVSFTQPDSSCGTTTLCLASVLKGWKMPAYLSHTQFLNLLHLPNLSTGIWLVLANGL